jgi:hypothetical protein
MFISQTSFPDMNSFAGLVCVPGILQFVANPLMTTLAGLQGLSVPPASFLWNAGNNVGPVFQQLRTIAALGPVAQCSGATSAFGAANRLAINYVAGDPSGNFDFLTCYLASWNNVCQYAPISALAPTLYLFTVVQSMSVSP